MAKETKKYDEDYLNGLIAKAKKSWEGVDVDSFMSELRDIDAVTIKCRDLMYGDWCCDKHGFQWQIIGVGDDYAYATFEGNEGDPWEFDDKDDQPEPIPLTPEILEKNGFDFVKGSDNRSVWNGWWIYKGLELATCCLNREGNWPCYINIYDSNIKCEYVHQLQHALRLCGLDELANNFKV